MPPNSCQIWWFLGYVFMKPKTTLSLVQNKIVNLSNYFCTKSYQEILWWSLTHHGLVIPYGDINLSQHWLRYWLVAWWHQNQYLNQYWFTINEDCLHLFEGNLIEIVLDISSYKSFENDTFGNVASFLQIDGLEDIIYTELQQKCVIWCDFEELFIELIHSISNQSSKVIHFIWNQSTIIKLHYVPGLTVKSLQATDINPWCADCL